MSNIKIILNRAKDYYENDKERLREQARDKYRNLSEEDRKYQKNIEEQKSLSIIMNKIVYVLFLANYSSLSISDTVSLLKSLSDSLFPKSSII